MDLAQKYWKNWDWVEVLDEYLAENESKKLTEDQKELVLTKLTTSNDFWDGVGDLFEYYTNEVLRQGR